jgi:hypothetical protein
MRQAVGVSFLVLCASTTSLPLSLVSVLVAALLLFKG